LSLDPGSPGPEPSVIGGNGELIRPIAGTALFMAIAIAGGYVRDALVASQIGARSSADGYFFGIQIGLAFQALFLLGPLVPALVPALRAVVNDERAFATLARAMFLWVVIATMAGSIVLIGMASPLVGILGTGLDHVARVSAIAVIQSSVPMLPFVGAGVAASAILNVQGKFVLPAAAWAASNLATAALMLPLYRLAGPSGIGLAWTLGNVLYAVVQIGPLQRAWEGGVWSFKMPVPVRRAFRNLWAISGFFATAQAGAIAERVIAAHLGSGAISQISYAEKLALIPTGVLGGAVSTVIFPRLSGLATDREGRNQLLASSLRATVMVVTPLSVWLMTMAPLTSSAAFERGALSGSDSSGIAHLLPVYALGAAMLAVATILLQALFASGRQGMAFRMGVLNTAFYVSVAVLLSAKGTTGLAWAWTMAQVTTVLIAAVLLRWRPRPRSVVRFGALLAWVLLATAAGLSTDRLITALVPVPIGIGRLPAVGGLAAVGIGVSVVALLLAPIREIRQLRRRFGWDHGTQRRLP